MDEVRFHRLTVMSVIEESTDAYSFMFDVPPELEPEFAYQPGQFLTLRVPCAETQVQRCYSLSSAPGVDAALKITVKRVRDGRASNWLCDCLKEGEVIEVMPPAGVFTPRSLDGDLLLFAGGSGITPILSIIKSALVYGRGIQTLIYANRDESSVIFLAELRQLVQRHPGRLRLIHWLDSIQGIPQQRHLEELARPWSQQETFICGPARFMEHALGAMAGLGLPRARIHVERFASLPDAIDLPPASDVGQGASEPGAAEKKGAAIETVLDGTTFQFESLPGETLLEAMLRTGLRAPNSCRMGQCGACMCRVETGRVALDRNPLLDDEERAAGWTLACCARPESAALRVVFPD
ncbi:ferredoxin--NADP reductase [Paraburkholderia hayleyella]|uniref:ferredoxin--NADP reductase n=1 Tax=Paraburkholderia hayleyella TaxID=2152889 RepID=UPI001292A55B|nr:ferredoxin--NADP reductase [Paraburkholderia hayleyella]